MNQRPPIQEIHRLLTDYAGLPLRIVGEGEPGATGGWDAVLEGQGVTFFIEYKPASGAEAVGAALRRIKDHPLRKARGVPLLVVPFMGAVGKDLCEHAGVAWLDISGNARITTPRLRIVIDGKPNLYAHRGRPNDPFAPKSSRVTRVLLLHPEAALSQSDLVRQTELDKGFVSRILTRLEKAGFIERGANGLLSVMNAGELLAAWRAAYDFSRHDIIRAVVATRSGPELLHRVSDKLRTMQVRHAATGLSAAWTYEPFASFRTVAVYVERRPDVEAMARIGAREISAGANLWLVVPNDEGVFTKSRVLNDIMCVSPLQTYLDLKGQPERADEAAGELLRVHLPWANT